jgi:hypothetical protein
MRMYETIVMRLKSVGTDGIGRAGRKGRDRAIVLQTTQKNPYSCAGKSEARRPFDRLS